MRTATFKDLNDFVSEETNPGNQTRMHNAGVQFIKENRKDGYPLKLDQLNCFLIGLQQGITLARDADSKAS
jgi:hypothetical protein